MLINSTVSRIITIGYGTRSTLKLKTGLKNKKYLNVVKSKSEVVKAHAFSFWESSDKIKPKHE